MALQWLYGVQNIHALRNFAICPENIKKFGGNYGHQDNRCIRCRQMGKGIAQVSAQSGYNVIAVDVEDRIIQNALKTIDKFMAKSVEKGKMTAEDKAAALGRIKGTTKIEDLKDADFVVEVVFEEMDLKKKVFKELDGITKKDVIISSNTSSMSITEIAKGTGKPDKVVGMHFFNPVPLMRLVEVIRGYYTSNETVAMGWILPENSARSLSR